MGTKKVLDYYDPTKRRTGWRQVEFEASSPDGVPVFQPIVVAHLFFDGALTHPELQHLNHNQGNIANGLLGNEHNQQLENIGYGLPGDVNDEFLVNGNNWQQLKLVY